MRKSALLLCAPLLALATSAARAEDSVLFNDKPATGWIITVSGTTQLGPAYEGANVARLGVIPGISWRKVGEKADFSAPDDGLDYALINIGRFNAGPVGNFRAGRYLSDDKDLIGLKKIPWTVEGGAYAEFWPVEDVVRTRVEVRHGLHGHHGTLADFSADLVQKIGAFRVSAGPRMEVADEAFMRKNFGISRRDSLRNGFLQPFDPNPGLKSFGAMVSANYAWSESWNTTAFGRLDRLVGDAAKSPLVSTIGQRNQLTVGIQMNYSFKVDF